MALDININTILNIVAVIIMALVGAYVGQLKSSFKETVLALEKKIDELTKALGGLMTEKMCGVYHEGHDIIHKTFKEDLLGVRDQIKHAEGSVAVASSRVSRIEADINGIGRKAAGLEEKVESFEDKYSDLLKRLEKIESK